MSKHVVLGLQDYDFEGDKGQTIKGIKVYYLDSEAEFSDHFRGYQPLTLTAPYDLLSSFSAIPGIYELDFRQKNDRKTGRVTLALRDAKYLDSFQIPEL